MAARAAWEEPEPTVPDLPKREALLGLAKSSASSLLVPRGELADPARWSRTACSCFASRRLRVKGRCGVECVVDCGVEYCEEVEEEEDDDDDKLLMVDRLESKPLLEEEEVVVVVDSTENMESGLQSRSNEEA